MKIIYAGNTGVADREKRVIKLVRSRLFSYHFVSLNFFNSKNMMDIAKNKVNLFLDSGAFSAWTQGVNIDIQEYIKFIKEHEKVIEVYANLDVISTGKIGNKESAKKTLKNQKIMEKAGLKPLPVFHYGEPLEYLQDYVNRYDYISLGGMVPISNAQLIPWLDHLFTEHLTDAEGMPKVKIHGFGLTSLRLMLRYPWYSVDSTSWVVTGRLGSIYVPRYRQGQWVYDEDSWKIAVSNRSPSNKEAGKHIDTLSKGQREIILDYIHDKGYILGKSEFKEVSVDYIPSKNERWAQKKKTVKDGKRLLEIIHEPGISNKYQLRDEMNILYFLDLEDSMQKWPWAFKKLNPKKSLF